MSRDQADELWRASQFPAALVDVGAWPLESQLAQPLPLALQGCVPPPRPQRLLSTNPPLQQQVQLQRKLQQQSLAQQAAMMQGHLFHPTLLSAMVAVEPIPSGNLPPGFDSTSCRSVYVGNVHSNVTEALLAELFSAVGPLEGCKLIRKEKSSYGFVDYFDHRSAAAALIALNGRQLFGQAIKVNWAFSSGQREDTTGHFNIFVGDLSPEVTDATLYANFSCYATCSEARVMWDQRSGRSRGFGFVSFRYQHDAESAIVDMNGKWLGNRPIRCNWATKTGAGPSDIESPALNSVQAAAPSGQPPGEAGATASGREGDQPNDSDPDAPQNSPLYTTVYVGNLAHEVTQAELHRQFYSLGAGVIEDVKVQRDKGFGFVRYRSHDEAAVAIQVANGRVLFGKSVKCSWGSKPSLQSAGSSGLGGGLPPPPRQLPPLPPPATALAPYGQVPLGLSPAHILAYQRQVSLAQAAVSRALVPMPPPAQQQQQSASLPLGMLGLAPSAPHGPEASLGPWLGFERYPLGMQGQQPLYY